ncbi:MAG: chorismate synthase [Clostridia bacterium]|nr:chorismate synthase [Clostridia bacterium]
MSSTFGENLRITIYGQSHSDSIGVTVEGFPKGFRIDEEELAAFMARRAPGKDEFSTPRKEADKVEFISGVTDSVIDSDTVEAVIYNTNRKQHDYSEINNTPRPGHADYTAKMKYGESYNATGGGHFSGRLTAPMCIAGGMCMQWLAKQGITVGAHIASIHGVEDKRFDPVNVTADELAQLKEKKFCCIDDGAADKMKAEILKAKSEGNSVGGSIECAVTGLPAGIGEHMFDGIENRISLIAFGIPAVKGIEFGAGFDVCNMYGSENNDEFYCDENGNVRTHTNNCGGILGGISNAMPVIFRVAIKPTPSIAVEQNTVSLKEKQNTTIRVGGRHDPCIVQRAVPCVEAAAAIAITDLILRKSV